MRGLKALSTNASIGFARRIAHIKTRRVGKPRAIPWTPATSRSELWSRDLNKRSDHLSPDPQKVLRQILQPHLPPRKVNASQLRPGSHLVYFPFVPAEDRVLADGTDDQLAPDHSYKYRLWAGGQIVWKQHEPILLPQPEPAALDERIVQVRGQPGRDNVWVLSRQSILRPKSAVNPDENTGRSLIIDARWLQLRKEKPVMNLERIVPPFRFSYAWHRISMVPTRTLLWRFSALTQNMHAIHIDPEYTRREYGLPDVIVHGPLTIILMLEVLDRALDKFAQKSGYRYEFTIRKLDYRNVAPIFVGDKIYICCKPLKDPLEKWVVWIMKKINGQRSNCVTGYVVVSVFDRETGEVSNPPLEMDTVRHLAPDVEPTKAVPEHVKQPTDIARQDGCVQTTRDADATKQKNCRFQHQPREPRLPALEKRTVRHLAPDVEPANVAPENVKQPRDSASQGGRFNVKGDADATRQRTHGLRTRRRRRRPRLRIRKISILPRSRIRKISSSPCRRVRIRRISKLRIRHEFHRWIKWQDRRHQSRERRHGLEIKNIWTTRVKSRTAPTLGARIRRILVTRIRKYVAAPRLLIHKVHTGPPVRMVVSKRGGPMRVAKHRFLRNVARYIRKSNRHTGRLTPWEARAQRRRVMPVVNKALTNLLSRRGLLEPDATSASASNGLFGPISAEGAESASPDSTVLPGPQRKMFLFRRPSKAKRSEMESTAVSTNTDAPEDIPETFVLDLGTRALGIHKDDLDTPSEVNSGEHHISLPGQEANVGVALGSNLFDWDPDPRRKPRTSPSRAEKTNPEIAPESYMFDVDPKSERKHERSLSAKGNSSILASANGLLDMNTESGQKSHISLPAEETDSRVPPGSNLSDLVWFQPLSSKHELVDKAGHESVAFAKPSRVRRGSSVRKRR
jgi:hydroxyacyl-ACP dehydratase HTD2-like protein with hotdog domain